jgi:hypothetical protein
VVRAAQVCALESQHVLAPLGTHLLQCLTCTEAFPRYAVLCMYVVAAHLHRLYIICDKLSTILLKGTVWHSSSFATFCYRHYHVTGDSEHKERPRHPTSICKVGRSPAPSGPNGHVLLPRCLASVCHCFAMLHGCRNPDDTRRNASKATACVKYRPPSSTSSARAARALCRWELAIYINIISILYQYYIIIFIYNIVLS